MNKNNYQDWTKDDLIKEIEHLKKRKKYGENNFREPKLVRGKK